MTSPTPPPASGSSGPPGQPPADGSTDIKPWLPAIGLGIVLVLLIVFFFLRSSGDDDTPATSTTTTSSSTTSSSAAPTTAPPTTAAPTTAAPTTAPPTTAPPTTAAPTTTAPPTTATTSDTANAKLVSDCNTGDEFACYEVGRLGLTPPASIKNPASWKNKTDDQVAAGCQQDLNVTACYVAGTRGLVLGD